MKDFFFFLAIATNIPQRLKTGFVLQGHKGSGFKEQDITHYLYCMGGHLMKLKCKYLNILRYWIFYFHEL